MNTSDKAKVVKIFFQHMGCAKCKQPFRNKCWEVRENYNKEVNAPGGCSACKKRRMRNKYSEILRKLLTPLAYKDVIKPQ
jgi:hypothetical protein